MSLPPPGGNGMMNRTGRTGYLSAACADGTSAAVARTVARPAARIQDADRQTDFNPPSSTRILAREKPPEKKISRLSRLARDPGQQHEPLQQPEHRQCQPQEQAFL